MRTTVRVDRPRRPGSDKNALRFQNEKERQSVARASVVGIEFALLVVGGLLGGYWLDERYATKPILTLIGFGFGCLAAFRILWKLAKQSEQDLDR
ncbi:MAG: AtpZ/AtpI family protein [Myxococcota bacterium]